MTNRQKTPTARQAEDNSKRIMSRRSFAEYAAGLDDVQRGVCFDRVVSLGRTLEQIRNRLKGDA